MKVDKHLKNIPGRFAFPYLTLKENWKKAWSYPAFRAQLVLLIFVVLFLVFFIPVFFNYIQSRPGYQLNDVILSRIPPRDLSLFTFLLIYSVVLTAIVSLIPYPILFLKFFQAYCLLTILRIFSLYLLPLEPDLSMIPLNDPLIGHFFYSGKMITKDLFFSGHVSTMFLLFLSIRNRVLKYYFFIAMLLVALCIILQHVHYTIDIVAAPVFSWISYTLAKRLPLRMNAENTISEQ